MPLVTASLPLPRVEDFCQGIRSSLKKELLFEVKQKIMQLVLDRIIVEEFKIVNKKNIPNHNVRLQTGGHAQNTPYSKFIFL